MLLDVKELPRVANMDMNLIHQDEVKVLNKLYDALEQNKPKEEIDALFKDFLKDVDVHFSEEEEMMKESGYWARAMHTSEHDTMKEKLNNLYEEWVSTGNNENVMKFLKDEFVPWLFLHISRWDAETAMHIGDTY